MSKKAERKKIHVDSNTMACKPLDSYSEILLFLDDPPPWRTLCKELTPHSNYLIKNMDINKHHIYHSLETPQNFCHFDPDHEDVDRYEQIKLPKTLLCHDMANGYHDDCIIDGTSHFDAYTFYNWAAIDIFCYFSHHLITIPPVAWINVGHAHGVRVIGTIISEWADGITFWDQALASETEYKNLANILVAIAKTLKFDGYLLNVENKISKPQALIEFVKYFHTQVHAELPHGVLLWYDSVTVEGNLNWQNKLNEKNKAYFDACDGFFTNYSWSEEDVTSSVVLAGDRISDLYIGIDVWGRNFYGGGQFNTQEAVKLVYAAGCSMAIFAPAWTHEAITSDTSDGNHIAMGSDLELYEQFTLRDRAFWGSIWPFLNTRVPCQMPFQTSFCRGQGKKRRLYGEVFSPSPWYNLRHQQYQPNAAHGAHGYILTSAANIIKVARQVQYKDKKGIIRYRSSIQMTRHELLSSSKESNMIEDEGFTTDSLVRSDEAIMDGEKHKKNKMKKAFKHLFKQKSSKTSDDKLLESCETKQAVTTDDKLAEPADTEKASSSNDKLVELCYGKKTGASTDNIVELCGGKKGSTMDVIHTEEKSEPGPSNHSERSMVQTSVNLRLSTPCNKTRYCLARVADERECLELYYEDSFTGGACLKINPSDNMCADHRNTRLLFCDFFCEDALIVCVVSKPLVQYSEQTLNVSLSMRNARADELSVVLTGRALAQRTPLGAAAAGINYVYPLDTADHHVLQRLRTYLLLNEPGFYVPIDNCYGWTVRYYEVSVPGGRISAINLRTGLPQGGILLGHFGICRKIHKTED